jgi:hypothetical protein
MSDELTDAQIALLCDIGEFHLPSLWTVRNATWSGLSPGVTGLTPVSWRVERLGSGYLI